MREGRAEWKTDRWTGAAIVSITDTVPICCVKECTEYKSQLRWFGQLIRMAFPIQMRNVISPACPGRPPEFILYFWWNLPVTLHPGGTHIRYPYHLNWLLRTDSGHTLSPS